MSGADKVVLCCLADDAAFAHVQRACASLELEAVRVTLPATLSADATTGVVLLVCDLEASDPRLALALVHHWRSLYPDRPLLAYLKPTRLAAELAARLGRVRGVTTWPQPSRPSDDSAPLRRLLRGLIAQAPDLLMRTLTEVLLGESPGDALGDSRTRYSLAWRGASPERRPWRRSSSRRDSTSGRCAQRAERPRFPALSA